MDFNLKKFASDASATFSRVVQFTEEKLGKAERTELDAAFDALLARADKTEEHTRKLLNALEAYLQPNPTLRVEEFFYDKFELSRRAERPSAIEHLGQTLTEAGNEFGAQQPYGATLLKLGAVQYKLGSAERDLIESTAGNTLQPIKRFLEGDMKTIGRERRELHNKRLDLDACKGRLRKARSLETQANGAHVQGQLTVDQAEADLRVAQSEFDKQAEIVKLLLEGVHTAHANHLKCMRDFVDAQTAYYANAHQLTANLQRELSGSLSADSGLSLFASGSEVKPSGGAQEQAAT